MSYYSTIDEDLACAKEILAKTWEERPGLVNPLPMIWGADIYAAYKLLESFVAEIERLRADRKLAVDFLCEVGDALTGTERWQGSLADARQLLAAHFEQHAALVVEIEDYRSSFALYDKASTALMQAYKAAHPDVPENVWPDATKVNVWAEAEIERLRGNEQYLTWLEADQMKKEIGEKDAEIERLRADLAKRKEGNRE